MQLDNGDRQQLIQVLTALPEFTTERGRRQILEIAGLGELAVRIDVSGTALIAASQIVSDLSRHERINENQTALELFIITVKSLTGLEQQAFLDQLLTKYQIKTSLLLSPDIVTQQRTQQQKILILTAIPHGLRLDREIREIEEAIRRAIRRERFEVSVRTAVRPQDIRRAIAEIRPQIVHLCGHGLPDGNLMLEDDGGNNKPVQPEGLAALFKLHTAYVNCVLLNTCYSIKPAEVISEYIPYAIGMNQAIGDNAAIAFAQGFYDALGYEASDNQDVFQRAFDEGLVAIQLENLAEGQTPVLKKKV